MALSVEAAELVEHFQWLTPDQSEDLSGDQCQAVGEELADILIYTLMVAMRLGIDLEHSTVNKMKQNRDKYPVEKSRGIAAKYDELWVKSTRSSLLWLVEFAGRNKLLQAARAG